MDLARLFDVMKWLRNGGDVKTIQREMKDADDNVVWEYYILPLPSSYLPEDMNWEDTMIVVGEYIYWLHHYQHPEWVELRRNPDLAREHYLPQIKQWLIDIYPELPEWAKSVLPRIEGEVINDG